MRHARDGTVLDVGRKTRTIPPAIRWALTARDRRCCFPVCDARRCDAHHVRHWADGGATRLNNLVLLCRRHHRAVHEEGFTVAMQDDGRASFFWPDGYHLPDVPPAPGWRGRPLSPTDQVLDQAGIAIDAHTATPDWYGERLDLHWAVRVLHPATADPVHRDVPAGTSLGIDMSESDPPSCPLVMSTDGLAGHRDAGTRIGVEPVEPASTMEPPAHAAHQSVRAIVTGGHPKRHPLQMTVPIKEAHPVIACHHFIRPVRPSLARATPD